MDVVTSFPAFFTSTVHGLIAVPSIYYAGVIALFFGLATNRTGGVFFVPVIAAVVYIAAQIVVPALIHHTDIVAPAFNLALAKQVVALYVVFLVADTVVFGIKKAILAIVG